jgi:Na+/proline symporter
VSEAYQITLVGAFVPLTLGLYWKRATTQGAVLSLALGVTTWILLLIPALNRWDGDIPGQLAGLLAALIGMIAGSLLPQWLPDHGAHTRCLVPKNGSVEGVA